MSLTTSLTGAVFSQDLADARDHVVEAGGDLAQGEDGGDEVVDEGQDDEDHGHEQDCAGGGHRFSYEASSRITSSEPP